jgi:hypothetical protein
VLQTLPNEVVLELLRLQVFGYLPPFITIIHQAKSSCYILVGKVF